MSVPTLGSPHSFYGLLLPQRCAANETREKEKAEDREKNRGRKVESAKTNGRAAVRREKSWNRARERGRERE